MISKNIYKTGSRASLPGGQGGIALPTFAKSSDCQNFNASLENFQTLRPSPSQRARAEHWSNFMKGDGSCH